jgi:UDP-2-acetamido-3-amino-2,3-dideoxy-glucuronate N-acetyltransferase
MKNEHSFVVLAKFLYRKIIKEKKPYFVHESSYVDENVIIGSGTKIWHFSHILSNVMIGSNCVIGQGVSIGPNVIIGNNVKIQNNVSLYEGVIVEDDVFIGPSAVFTNVLNPRSTVSRKNEFKQTILKKGCSIGANVTIVCGNTIGEYSLVGAGSVVISNVQHNQIVAGNPAIYKGMICKCGKSYGKNYVVCDKCK